MRNILLAIALILSCAFGAAWQSGGQKVKVVWEYRMVFIPEKTSEADANKILNEFGAEGWEAYAVNQNGLDVTTGQYFFKRQK